MLLGDLWTVGRRGVAANLATLAQAVNIVAMHVEPQIEVVMVVVPDADHVPPVSEVAQEFVDTLRKDIHPPDYWCTYSDCFWCWRRNPSEA